MKKSSLFGVLTVMLVIFIFVGIACSALDDGLVAYYEFEGNPKDSSINNYNADEFGTVKYVNGISGKGALFRKNGYIVTPRMTELNTNQITISLWAYLLSSPSEEITQIIEAHTDIYEFYLETVSFSTILGYNVNHGILYSPHLPINRWTNIILVFDSSSQKIYVDGKLSKYAPLIDQLNITTGFSVGRDYELDMQYFDGIIDSLRIYNRALSESEIRLLAGYVDLSFPLHGYAPNTAPITSVFDHSMTTSYIDDNKVVSFTNERGESIYGKDWVWGTHYGFKNSTESSFFVNGNYTGGGNPLFLYYDGHPGYDYSTKDLGVVVPVIAAAPGIAHRGNLALGEVYIDHQNGFRTYYLHLIVDSRLIADNTPVATGQELGIAGGTGGFPVHLHFEVRREIGGVYVPVDPYGWIGCGNDPYTKTTNINLWGETIPVAPSCLTARAISPSQIVLGWKDNSNHEIGFKVQRILGDCLCTSTWKQIATKPADVTIHTNSGLLPNTTYAYQVSAYDADGNSLYSNCVSANTGQPATPHSPTNLKATSISSNQVNLTWMDNSLGATEYKIYRKTGTGEWVLLSTIGVAKKRYIDTTATGNDITTIYSYYIKACNSWGCSPATNGTSVPLAPAALTAEPLPNSAKLAWTDKSSNEKGFQVYRKEGNCTEPGSWSQLPITTTLPNTKTCTDAGLAIGTYSYHIRSYTQSLAQPYAYGYSVYSNCISVTVP